MATFAGIATSNSDFSILVDVLVHIDANLDGSALVATLDDASQDLTVFAPTNAAFGALAADLGFAGDTSDTSAVTNFLVANVDVSTLNAVILYHVSAGAQSSGDIATAGSVDMLGGGTIDATNLPTLGDAEPDLLDPSLTAIDIAADNGTLHVIDRVLLPVDLPGNDAPTLTGIVASSGGTFDDNGGDFDLLLNAVVTAGLDGALDDENADLTVFAPTDDAFIGLAQTLGFGGSDEEGAFGYLVEALTLLGLGNPIPLLTDVLTYHVVPEGLQSSEVIAQGSFPTLQGGTLTLDGFSLQDADPDLPDPSLIALDIQASNGIAHVIDGVLIPADILNSDGANDVDFIIAGDGDDVFNLRGDADFIDGNGGNDRIHLGTGDDVALGGAGNDRITGAHDRDFIDGGAGDDTLFGNSESDTLMGGDGDDRVSGQRSFDYLDGGAGDDIVIGGAGTDTLMGGDGDDKLFGQSGRDTLNGGAGDDTLNGGSSNDTFVFEEGTGSDRINGFNAYGDVIDVTDYEFADFDALMENATQTRTHVEIDLGGGDMIMISGGNLLALDDSNFLI